MLAERIARLLALGIAMLGGLLLIGAGWQPDINPDADAYWNAAMRLRGGMDLYGGSRLDETEIYRYAPWFAYAWVPLTYLGADAAYLVWRGVLFAAAVGAVWPLVRRPSPASLTLAVLVFALLVSNLPAANVTGLIVGALALSLHARPGPVVVGLAASLKVFPILLVLGYVAERRWRAAAVSVGVASVLWLHVLAFGLSTIPTQVGGESFFVGGVSLFAISPWLWGAGLLLLAAVIGWLVWRRSPWAWLAVAAAIPVAVPRVWLPDAAYVATGVEALDRRGERRAGWRVPL